MKTIYPVLTRFEKIKPDIKDLAKEIRFKSTDDKREIMEKFLSEHDIRLVSAELVELLNDEISIYNPNHKFIRLRTDKAYEYQVEVYA